MAIGIFRSYTSGQSYSRIRVFLSKDGNMVKINRKTWYEHDLIEAHKFEENLGNIKDDAWDLEVANEPDLKRIFKELALGNPQDFKNLYYALKEKDETIFPILESVLEEVQSLFNFE